MAFLVLTIVLASYSGQAQPQLVLPDGLSFDFGKVVAGEKATHIVRLWNAGSDTLRIQNVTSQCNCSTTRLSTRVLPPGVTGTLEVTYASDFDEGRVSKYLSVVTNEGLQKVTLVSFEAEVVSFLEADPQQVVFSATESVSMTPKAVTLTNVDTSVIHVLSVIDTTFLVVAENEAITVNARGSAQLFLVPKPVGEQSRYGTIELHTDNPRQRIVRLSYKIEGSGRMR